MRDQCGARAPEGDGASDLYAWAARLVASFLLGGFLYVNLLVSTAPLVKAHEGPLGGILVLFLLGALPLTLLSAYLLTRSLVGAWRRAVSRRTVS